MKKNYTYISFARYVTILLLSILMIGLHSSCKKASSGDADTIGKASAAPILYTPLTWPSAKNPINPVSRANSAFDGFLAAFLVRSNGATYITDGLVKRDRAFMWQQAYMITMVEDAYDRDPSTVRKQLITDLMDSFLLQDKTNLSWDSWNDDLEWALIALVRAYKITNKVSYLNAAITNFNIVWDRGWDNTFNGGIWEDQNQVPSGGKCGLSNWPMIIAGTMIYESTQNDVFLDKCKRIYDWAKTHCYDANSGIMYEGWGLNGINGDDNYYNTGLLVNAAASLYKITQSDVYLKDAITAADNKVSKWGVLTVNKVANGGFGADQLVRGIAKLARENKLETKYYPWLVRQCIADWNTRRTDYNYSLNDWSIMTGNTGEQLSMECMSSVVTHMVTPEAETVTVPDGTYKIINKQTGKALSTAGNNGANNTQLTVKDYAGESNQKWTLTNTGDGTYKLISGNGKSINISGNSQASDANLILWDYSGTNNERIYFSSAAAGYYSMFFVSSGKVVDIGKDLSSLTQQLYIEGSSQQWQFLAP
jgi:hypothetical protein